MQLVLKGYKLEEPVEMWLEMYNGAILVRASKRDVPWTLMKFTEKGFHRVGNVPNNLGFPVDSTGRVENAE